MRGARRPKPHHSSKAGQGLPLPRPGGPELWGFLVPHPDPSSIRTQNEERRCGNHLRHPSESGGGRRPIALTLLVPQRRHAECG